jgi:uncharacterized protein YgiM (DUF1202 family)
MKRNFRLMMVIIGFALALFVAGCQPLSISEDGAASAADNAAAEMNADGDGATGVITARSLRVRGEPSADAEVVSGVREGEIYKVMSISEDGEWVQLAIARAPGGNGWVSANFVSVNGEISGAAEGAAAGDTTGDEGPAMVEVPKAGMALIFTDGTRLRVRAEPSVDAEIVGYVHNGEIYPVVGLNDDETWVQIEGAADSDNPDGGWVAAEFVVIGE